MAGPHESAQIGQQLQGELDGDAPELANQLFGGNQPDATGLSRPAYSQYVARHWADPTFRTSEAAARPEAFLQAFRDLGGVLPGEDGHTLTLAPTDTASPQQTAVSGLTQGGGAPGDDQSAAGSGGS